MRQASIGPYISAVRGLGIRTATTTYKMTG